LIFYSLKVQSQSCTISLTNPSPSSLKSSIESASAGQIICISGEINLNGIILPIEIPSGVTVRGNYDLLSQSNGTSTSPSGTLIISQNRVDLMTNTVQSISVFKMNSGYTGQPTTIENIRIKGPSQNWIDYSNFLGFSSGPNYQSAGIYLNNAGTGGGFRISHNEIYGFSYAGIFGEPGTDDISIDHCYIHNIKGFCEPGIGYGNWFQNNGILTEVNLDNNIYNDCKEAIDGQSGSQNWSINNCTMTQFFYGGIARHNGKVTIQHPASSDPLCTFYNRNGNPQEPANVPWSFTDVAGGNSTLSGVISHFKLAEDGSRGGLCGFPYPYTIPLTTLNSYSQFTCNPSSTQLASLGTIYNTSDFIGDLNNGGWTNIPIGFSFNFFGNAYPTCNISTNGFLQFGPTFNYASIGEIIPNASGPNNFIAMCMTDLDFTVNGSIQYCLTGTAPNRIFQIEWNDGKHAIADGFVIGHLKLFESTDVIEIQIYRQTINDVIPRLPNIFKLAGIENENGFGLAALNFYDWDAGLSSLAYHFERPEFYDITLSGNTINSKQEASNFYTNNYGGYATIADNYIESCPWYGDNHIKYSTATGAPNDNAFDYSPGNAVIAGCPQPPECNITLKEVSNVVLPLTNINSQYTPNGYSYIPSGTSVKIEINPGTLGSQNNVYIVNTNPDHGVAVANNSSGNNFYYDDQMVLGPALNTQSTTYSLYDASKPGLHGIDVLAVAATNSTNPLWSEYHASSWQHIPLISVPSYDESHLVFHIKDSYYEQYTPSGTIPHPLTGVLKTVELNGYRIWEEDISEGGDGWERIDIPLFNNPAVIPEWLVPIDKGKNLLSFSINFAPGAVIDSGIVRGVSVWIDDVYINRFDNDQGTNLIVDGDIENEKCGTLPTIGSDCLGTPCNESCTWFIQDKNTAGYPIVCNSSQAIMSGEEEYYNDGNIIDRITSPGAYKCDGYLSGRDRKSGQTSIVLNLPRLYRTSCATYNIPTISSEPPNGTLPIEIPFLSAFYPGVMSAFTQFEFPHCGAFEKDLENEFSMPLIAVSGIVSPDSYNLNKSITIDAGATLEFNNSTLAIGPGVSITVPANSTLILNASTLNACSDMWTGIINNGGNVIIQNGSVVEDAITALTVNSGTFKIQGSVFDHNHQGVKLNSGTYDPGSNWIYDSRFRCSNGEISKRPFENKITSSHFFADKVDNFKLGDNSYGTNYFQNATNAVRVYNSNMLLENNNFTFIDYPGKDNRKKIAVNAWTDFFTPTWPNPTPDYSLSILGVLGSSTINTFENWETGVKTNQVHNIRFENNSILGCKFGLSATRGRKLIASNNSVYRFQEGISCFDFWQLETALKQYEKEIFIIDNVFNESGVYNSDNYGRVAINVQNGLGHIMHTWIENNNIRNSEIGIHLRSVYWARMLGNHYEAYIPNSDITRNHFGIWVEDSPYADINFNTAERLIDAGDVLSHTSTVTESDLLRGYSLDNCQNSTVTNNSSTNMGSDFRVYGQCIGSEIRCNDMHSSFRGINLVNATIVGGTSYGSLSDATGNTWNDEYLNNTNERIDGNWNSPNQIDWWHEGNVHPANNYCPYYHTTAVFPSSASVNSSCPFINPYRMDDKDKEYIKKTALDILNYEDFEIESKLKDDDYSYQAAKLDPDLLIDPTPAAILIDQWYQAMKLGNPGKYSDAKEFVAAHNKQAAQLATYSIVDSNLVIQNQKQTMQIYLDRYFERDTLETDSATLATLYSIATQNAMLGGTGVYNARAMLNLDVQDYLQIGLRTKRNTSEAEVDKNHFTVSPNPANTKCILTFYKPLNKRITVADLLGKPVQFYSLAFNENQLELDLSKLKSGSYTISVVYDSTIRENEILIVVH